MSQLEKKYSWSEMIENSKGGEKFEITTSDKIIELLSQASEEDRKQVLKIFTNLLGKEYSEDMIENHDSQGDKVEAEMNIFRKIFASLDEENLQEQYDFLKSAMDEEDDDEDDNEDEDDEEKEDKEDEDDDDDFTKDSSFDQLIKVIASWEPEDRKAVYEIFRGLLGDKYSNDSVKDYIPKGKARDVSKPQPSGQFEASSKDNVKTAKWRDRYEEKDDNKSNRCDSCEAVMINGVYCHEHGCPRGRQEKLRKEREEDYEVSLKNNVKTASKKDRKEVSNLYRNLFGSKFVDKMVALYEPKGKKSITETSGQTKTSSYDPWGLKTSKKEWNPNPWAVCEQSVGKKKDPEKFERCVKDVKSKQSKPLKKNEEE